jgi:hypothetical protein
LSRKSKIPKGWLNQVVDTSDLMAHVTIGLSIDCEAHSSVPDGKRLFIDLLWEAIYAVHRYHNEVEDLPNSRRFSIYRRMAKELDEFLKELNDARLWLAVKAENPTIPTHVWGFKITFVLTADTVPRMSLENTWGRFIMYLQTEAESAEARGGERNVQ